MAHRDKFGRTTFGRKWTRRDDPVAVLAPLPITLPLKISRSTEAFAVMDATGRNVCYLYFEDAEPEGQQPKWFTEAEAGEVAQMIARLLTDVQADA